MTESAKLLEDYARRGSEAAFRELVNDYVGLVYSAAVRIVDGDAHLAQDVAQTVFADLARKAAALSENVMLGGWLHRRTCHVAATMMRSQRRRQSRERQAVEMNVLHLEPDPQPIGPLLDETINRLDPQDRAAILLRFFEQRNFRAIGQCLGVSEDAARMRVSRAIEKLRQLLITRGVTSSAAALTATLTTEATTAAPAGLANSIATSALASASTGIGIGLSLFKIMSLTKLQSGALSLLVLAGATTILVLQYQTESRLRRANLALTQQLARLKDEKDDLANQFVDLQGQTAFGSPQPTVKSAAAPTNETADSRAPSLYERVQMIPEKLTTQQVEGYLKDNNRSAASLLAAFRTTGDQALLEEAMKNFPNDPEVVFEAAFKNDASPEQRRQWLDAFEKSDPNNSLANYLSAHEYFKVGQADLALQELAAAAAKPQFQDYSINRVQNDGEAFLAAGYSPDEARVASSEGLVQPQLSEMTKLGQELLDLAKSYRQAGDSASALSALQMALGLGQRYSTSVPGETTESQLAGIDIERMALGAMDPNAPYGYNGHTVQYQLDQINQQKDAIASLDEQFSQILPTMNDQDLISYENRMLAFGDQAAEQWAIAKHGSP